MFIVGISVQRSECVVYAVRTCLKGLEVATSEKMTEKFQKRDGRPDPNDKRQTTALELRRDRLTRKGDQLRAALPSGGPRWFEWKEAGISQRPESDRRCCLHNQKNIKNPNCCRFRFRPKAKTNKAT
ncbi:hypothetical protein FRB91_004932 [Serendipita sp. 411]|nr:hypothetical protein FRB91_004932 [Serendipita sp. 411]